MPKRITKHLFEIVFVFIGIAIIIFNNLYFTETLPIAIPALNIIGGLIAVVPSSWLFYRRFKESKEIEEQFIVFINDLAESINSGMTLPLALEQTSNKDYGFLSSYINDMASQVNWGIPFKKALQILAKKTNSVPIKRAVTTIIETYRVGGKLSHTMLAVGESLMTIDKIRKERSASVHSQILTSYLIYFVFIFILIILQTFLLPVLAPVTASTSLSATSSDVTTDAWQASFVNFIIVQGFFAGLATGKMSEGALMAGIKHSILLITIGYTLFSFASQLEISVF